MYNYVNVRWEHSSLSEPVGTYLKKRNETHQSNPPRGFVSSLASWKVTTRVKRRQRDEQAVSES
jgi:hypothetical protein